MEENQIVNVGNTSYNSYLYPIPDGYVLIDTGREKSYPQFLLNLSKKGISPGEIRYLFLTHSHNDHTGFMTELLTKHDQIIVIMSEKALPAVMNGVNTIYGGCTGLLMYLVGRWDVLTGKKYTFPPVTDRCYDRLLMITEQNRSKLDNLLHAKILDLPGHTSDSVGLLVDNKFLFCGDAAMNGYPSKHRISIIIENKEDYMNTWKYMLLQNPSMVFPTHGKPFMVNELRKFMPCLEKAKIYPFN